VIESSGSATTVMAVVHTADGVRCVAAGANAATVASGVAEYVRQRCDDVLWPDAARQVHAMLDAGDLYAAISHYFDRTGERWDEERLELLTVPDCRIGANFEQARMAGA
jgi:hypothetical protein